MSSVIDRFRVMTLQLSGNELPPLPEVPGRVVLAQTPTDDDPPAEAWNAANPAQHAAFAAELDAGVAARRERAAASHERRSAAIRAAWARRRQEQEMQQ